MSKLSVEKWTHATLDRFLKEQRGIGEGRNYRPWFEVDEFSSNGRARRLDWWQTGRVHHLFSDHERRLFHLCAWSNRVVDIREQYPLLDLELAMKIAADMGIKYPQGKDGTPWVLTTDFMLTLKQGEERIQIPWTVKPTDKLQSKTVMQNFELEKRYYAAKGNNRWSIITQEGIHRGMAENIEWFFSDYWLEDDPNLHSLKHELKIRLKTKNKAIHEITTALDKEMNIAGEGISLRIFRHLLARKEVIVDMKQKSINGYLLTNEILEIIC
ncbi:TnsA endonuclease N-terminal domain-containing protein [Phormidium sp. FACHB-592]|uniref:TnsA endonuclease N-terminal domain-containing protein n=1 Tax=Stenomitos frigidus AS-A4 TaxID=2933935 RepID=A0ABV0KKG2_9CYAN|nr:TnsA endonuclease N-terminal domain-containing protein [Phormidium sp. FACHB-592]MBD2077003.1 TnsA endonuclease N-terminal domain-containing protein [Phormidium sp. FACHB-592]